MPPVFSPSAKGLRPATRGHRFNAQSELTTAAAPSVVEAHASPVIPVWVKSPFAYTAVCRLFVNQHGLPFETGVSPPYHRWTPQGKVPRGPWPSCRLLAHSNVATAILRHSAKPKVLQLLAPREVGFTCGQSLTQRTEKPWFELLLSRKTPSLPPNRVR